MEQNELIADHMKQVFMYIDMILMSDGMEVLEEARDGLQEKVSIGYAVPMFSYAHADKARDELALLESLIALCEVRKEQQDNIIERANTPDHDALLRQVLGFR